MFKRSYVSPEAGQDKHCHRQTDVQTNTREEIPMFQPDLPPPTQRKQYNYCTKKIYEKWKLSNLKTNSCYSRFTNLILFYIKMKFLHPLCCKERCLDRFPVPQIKGGVQNKISFGRPKPLILKANKTFQTFTVGNFALNYT